MAEQEVGNLAVRISLDSANFEQSMASINRNLRTLGQEMRGNQNLGRDWGNSIAGLTTKQDTLTRTFEAQQIKVNRLRESYEASVAATGENSAVTENLATQLNRAQAELNRTETELGQVRAALQQQQDALRLSENSWTQLGERMREVGSQMQKVGDTMSKIGKEMSLKVTAPIVAMGVLSAKAAIDFESSFAGIRKTVDATESEFAELEKGIRDMAKSGPTAATELAAIGESAGQLGIETKNILAFTSTVSDIAVATNMTAEQAATDFARFANIVQMPQTEFDKLGSTIVALGNNFATTESEIMDMGMRLAGVGAQVGLSESEIMGLSATMSSLGISSEAGGTAMSTVLKKIDKSVSMSKEAMQGFADAAGMTTDDFAKLWKDKPIEALDAFIKNLAKSAGEGENLTYILDELGIKGIRESDTIMRMVGAQDLLSEAVDLSSKAWNENSALTNEAAQRYATTQSQLETLRNKFTDIAISLGDILIPVILKVVEAIEPWIEKFANLDESAQKTIMAVSGIAAAIGPLLVIGGTLISSIGSIVGVLGTVSLAIGSIATGVASAVPGVAALAGAFTALALPIGIAVAAIAAIGLTYQLLKIDADSALKSQEAVAEQNLELAQSHTAVLDEQLKQTDATAELISTTLEQAQGVDALIRSYEDLTEKSKLSTDELGQFLTMQTQIEGTKSPERIKELEDSMNGLREKSGLSKSEFDKLLESNRLLTEQFPEAGAVVDDYGNKIADTTGKLREMTAAELERKEIEVFNQMASDVRALNGEIDSYEDILMNVVKLETEVASKKQEIAETQTLVNRNEVTQKGLQSEILSLKEQQKDASIKEWYQLEAQKNELKMQNGQLDQKNKKHNKNLEVLESTLATEESTLAEMQKQQDKIGNLIDSNNTNLDAYTKILEAQFDINIEKGKENESIDKAIGKRKEEIKLLQDKIKKEGDSNGELQKSVDHLKTENSQLSEAKTKLDGINGVLDTQVKKYDSANDELKKVNNKYMEGGKHIDDNAKKTDNLNEKLDKSHKKDVTIKTNKDPDEENNKWSKPISKVIEFFTKGKAPDAYAKGTNFHGGGSAWLGEEGPELVKMGNQLQLMNFGLYDLPVGAKVWTHDETMSMLKNNSIASINNATRMMGNSSMPHVNQVGQSASVGSTTPTIQQTINIHSPKHLSPSETARLQKRASQELALGW